MKAKLEKLLDELHGESAGWTHCAKMSRMCGDPNVSERCYTRAQTIEGFIERLQKVIDSEETPG